MKKTFLAVVIGVILLAAGVFAQTSDFSTDFQDFMIFKISLGILLSRGESTLRISQI